MMPKFSAGLLPYRSMGGRETRQIEVFLVHPGGPFWAKKDDGAWSIVKGEYDPAIESDATQVASREFREETGQEPPPGEWIALGEVRQPSGKRILAWAVLGDVNAHAIVSNTFQMEWPPKSGKTASFPEVDQGAWFSLHTASTKILRGQLAFLDALTRLLT
jgi:predicted NUDIX family NTP pyrophosphohydrolase